MTIIDLAVIVLALSAFRYVSVGGFLGRSRGRTLIMLGVAAYALFFLADLALMHFGPLLATPAGLADLLELQHLYVLHFGSLLGVILIAAGVLATSKAQLRDERRLGLMTEALPLAVAYVDLQERYRFANRRFAALHGHTPETLLGARVVDVLRPDLYERFREHNARALRGEAQSYESRALLDLDGEMHDLHVDLVPEVLADGRVGGFFLLVLDTTERVQLERDVVRAAEAERLTVARDLHDGLGQSLTGLSLALSALARKLQQENSPHAATVARLTETAQNTIAQARQYTHVLAPTMQGGLFGALRTLAREVSTLWEVQCFTTTPPDELPIGPATAMHLYRIAQESVNNAARHGHATAIRILCRVDGPVFVLEVLDDGLGIPVGAARRDGLGLKSMYYRARMIGGVLKIRPMDSGGTKVSCKAPLASLRKDLPGPSPGRVVSEIRD
jgi:PAS domain S-box-containing protein